LNQSREIPWIETDHRIAVRDGQVRRSGCVRREHQVDEFLMQEHAQYDPAATKGNQIARANSIDSKSSEAPRSATKNA